MKRLWAPWRLKYVKSTDQKSPGCVFCIDSEDDDEVRFIVHRGEHCFVMMNLYPYNNGHLLVVPYRHTSEFSSLTQDEILEMMDLIKLFTEIERECMGCHGFNIGLNIGRAAGAGIADHLHFHIVPRWSGDANFMPVIGQTKVIPQSIEDSYNMLLRELKGKLHVKNSR